MENTVFKAHISTIERMSTEGLEVLKGYISHLREQSSKYKNDIDMINEYYSYLQLIEIAQDKVITILSNRLNTIKSILLP